MKPTVPASVLVAAVLGGCTGVSTSSAPEPVESIEPIEPVRASPASSATPVDAVPPADEASEHPAIATVQLQPDDGTLHEQLVLHAARAYRAGLNPVVEMQASWCPICRRVDTELDGSRARSALRDVVLIRVDTDVWADDLRGAGLRSPTIPAFYPLDRRGKPGEHLAGHHWGPRADVVGALEQFVEKAWSTPD